MGTLILLSSFSCAIFPFPRGAPHGCSSRGLEACWALLMAKLYFTSQMIFIHIFHLTTTLVSASILSPLATALASLASLHFLTLPLPLPALPHREEALSRSEICSHSFLVKLQQLCSALRLKLKSLWWPVLPFTSQQRHHFLWEAFPDTQYSAPCCSLDISQTS